MNMPGLSALIFLSGFAVLAMSGCDSDDGTNATDGAASTGGMTTEPAGTTGASGPTDASGISGTTTGDSTTGTTVGDVGVCADFAAKSVKCDAEADYDEALTFCNEALESLETTYSAECSQAYEEVLVCAVQVGCDEFTAQDEVPRACVSLSTAYGEICGFGGSTGG